MYKQIDERIEKVEGLAISSPYGKGNSFSYPLGVKSVGIIKIYSESGQYGLGETYVGVYAPELIQPIAKFLESFIIGKSIGSASFIEDMQNIPFIGRNGVVRSVISAIETAIWDLRGKLLETPTYKLLNSESRRSVPIYASSGTVVMSPEDITLDVGEIMGLGYKAYKMRVGFQSWSDDIKRVRSAREALGDADLMVDAIMGTLQPPWEADYAINCAKDLVDFNLRWLEEPVHPDNIAGLAKVRKSNIVPIAAGEAYSGNGEFQSLLYQNSVDILQFDATHSGGILPCFMLANKAKSLNLESAMHVWGSAVAISANAQVALASEDVETLEIPMVSLEINRHMWASQPKTNDGVWKATGEPGLGVVLDDETIRKYPFQPGSGYRLQKK